MDTTLDFLRNIYLVTDENFDSLYQNTPDPNDRKQLLVNLHAARDTYYAARLKALEENEPAIIQLKKDIKTVTDRIQQDVDDLAKVSQVLGFLGQLVGMGAKLFALASI